MKLRHQLVTLSLGLSLLLILILGSLLALFIRHLLESNLQDKGSDLARVMAADTRVVEALRQGSDPTLRDYVEAVCNRTDATYMVVTDEHGRRLSHPNPELVGQKFRGEDIWPALQERRSYCSKDRGTMGPAIRCFSPVVGGDGRVMGAVVVGYLMQQVEGIYMERVALLISAIVAVLGCGLLLALWVQYLLRKTLLDLEPEAIVRRFTLQDLVLEHITEGVIALDGRGNINMINSTASYQLRLPVTGAPRPAGAVAGGAGAAPCPLSGAGGWRSEFHHSGGVLCRSLAGGAGQGTGAAADLQPSGGGCQSGGTGDPSAPVCRDAADAEPRVRQQAEQPLRPVAAGPCGSGGGAESSRRTKRARPCCRSCCG